MTLRTFVAAKLHGLAVTHKSVEYRGSVSVDRRLLAVAGMAPFERVEVVNLANGNRWSTYLLPDDRPGVFSLNGGGARLGEVGDRCVLMTYALAEAFGGARAVHLGAGNAVAEVIGYADPAPGA